MRNLNKDESKIYDAVVKKMSTKTGIKPFDIDQMRVKFKSGDYVQHTKGGIYLVLNIATIEKTKELAYVYMDVNSKQLWVRPVDEMEDGRFTKI